MKSGVYKERKGNLNLVTNEIAIRGFVRELKATVLEGEEYSLIDAEYERVASAFMQSYYRKLEEKLSLVENYSKAKIQSNNKYEFIGSSGFSKWWKGQTIPGEAHRNAIELVTPKLLSKWFNRSKFTNRLQLHLASLDLLSLSRVCNCKKDKLENTAIDQQCDLCLDIAIKEARWILNSIHEDWRPKQSNNFNLFDVCISGPLHRSGLNVFKNRFDVFVSKISKFKSISPDADEREFVDYNLELSETSDVGLPLPKEIVKIYQDENPFSVFAFLFLILGMNLKANSDYRDDLIMDFLTSLNCISILLFTKYGGFMSPAADFLEEKLQRIIFHAFEYYFDDSFDLATKLHAYEELVKKSKDTGTPNFDNIFHPITHFTSHNAFKLAEDFLGILEITTSRKKINKYMRKISKRTISSNSEITIVDEYMASPYLEIFKSIEDSRDRYYEKLQITGYSKTELAAELKKTVTSPMNIRYTPGEQPQKPSPYRQVMEV